MNRKIIGGLLLLAVLGVGGYFGYNAWQSRLGQQAIAASGLQYLSLDAALAQSRASGKPVLVDFSAIWCPVCRAMHEAFADTRVRDVIEHGYVLARVDYDSDGAPAFMQKYDVTGFPSLLVLNGEGQLLRRVEVSTDPATLAHRL